MQVPGLSNYIQVLSASVLSSCSSTSSISRCTSENFSDSQLLAASTMSGRAEASCESSGGMPLPRSLHVVGVGRSLKFRCEVRKRDLIRHLPFDQGNPDQLVDNPG